MKVKDMIRLLNGFNPDDDLRVFYSLTGHSTHFESEIDSCGWIDSVPYLIFRTKNILDRKEKI